MERGLNKFLLLKRGLIGEGALLRGGLKREFTVCKLLNNCHYGNTTNSIEPRFRSTILFP